MNPCVNCKRYPNCPNPCYPKKDYLRHLKKRKKKKDDGERTRTISHGNGGI